MPAFSTVSGKAAGSSTGCVRARRQAVWSTSWSQPAAMPTGRLSSICTGSPPPTARPPRQRAELAAAYFRENAAQWDKIRSLYIDEREVEAALGAIVAAAQPADLLDIGTGTGRMLEVLGPHVGQALGIDQSREMLAVARVNLERAGFANGTVRLGDMYQLPLPDARFDAAVIHQVLHYAERPGDAIAEAARVLRPNGVLIVADFAPHTLEFLREEQAHRRLGSTEGGAAGGCRGAALDPAPPRHLPGDPLTVVIWTAFRREPAALPQRGVRTAGRRAAAAEKALLE